jgi:RND superfamily putative drug exporter
MISRILGQMVRRAWPFLLLGWAVLVFGTGWAAPPWAAVAQDREFAFLPESAPSRQAEQAYARAFPDARASSNVVLVLHRTAGAGEHLAADKQFIEKVIEAGLRKIAAAHGGLAIEPAPDEGPLFGDESAPPARPKAQPIMARIRTPNAPGSGALLVSPDRQVLLVVVELTTSFVAHRNWPVIEDIEGLVRDLRRQGKVPPGLEVAVTGSAVIGRDHSVAQLQSAHATERLTVFLVITLLVLIYRAPLLALIPLVTVYLAVQVSINVLALLGQAGYVTVFQGLQIYITILAYGAGVDYCLFLTARYKEELDKGTDPGPAIADAVSTVGHALAASAATVICGIAMMYFAQFGKFREAGIAIPLALFLVFCATMTFSPALLRLAGRWAFWPQRPRPAGAAAEAEHAPERRNALQRIWDRVGQILLRRPGAMWLATAGVMAPFVVIAGLNYSRVSYDMIGDLPADAPSVAGTQLLQDHFPAGMMGPITVLLDNPKFDFRSPHGKEVVEKLTERLAAERPQLGLHDVRSLTAPLGLTPAAANAFAGSDVPKEARREAAQRAAVRRYVYDKQRTNDGTRLELLLKGSPFSHRSIEDLDKIERAVRAALPDGLRSGTTLYFVGTTASVRDLAAVMQTDRVRIELLVLAAVFVILVILLRRLVATVYLLLSVLFSYYATLGVTFLVFWALDPQGFAGLDWKVVIFLFTILIAVGEDYNIFLMTRIDEESKIYGPVRGITEALDRTGPIISSCGIIMAGTFASLLAGSLAEMKQLGFALAFGVLLDTFVVRPILVPAFLILLRSGRLKPGGRRRGPQEPSASEAAPTHFNA